jgi:5-histidylcysteine sulfoxide synthase
MTLTRNPNLDSRKPTAAPVRTDLPKNWWTGVAPNDTHYPGLDLDKKVHALPAPNLHTCSRQLVLDYFNNGWAITEVLFSSLSNESDFLIAPYHALRHPMIFYYGHPAALYVNKLRVAGLIDSPINSYFEAIFETGVDEMSWDDMSKNEMTWPSLEQTIEYRRSVYEAVCRIINRHPDLENGHPPITASHALWALFLGFEHERIHIETSSVLLREFPLERLRTPKLWPDIAPRASDTSSELPNKKTWKHIEGGVCEVGKSIEHPIFGWDNEYGKDSRLVTNFECSPTLISNAEFLDFVKDGGYTNQTYWTEIGWSWRSFRNVKWPTFWVPSGPQGSHEYGIRTLFSIIPFAAKWPAVVNFHEAQAYASWLSEKNGRPYRLPCEAEHRWLHHLSNTQEPSANLNLKFGSECDVTSHLHAENLYDTSGNVWQWLADHFHPLPGFRPHAYYEDFSLPCFDGEHQMILGGSFASAGNEATAEARFHFRPHFFQHAGFRLVTEGRPATVQIEKNPKNLEETVINTVRQWEKHRNESIPPGGLPFRKDLFKDASTPEGSPVFPDTWPEYGTSVSALAQSLVDYVFPFNEQPGHPRYLSYLAGGNDPVAALGDWMACRLNCFSAHESLSKGATALEHSLIRWLCGAAGFSEKSWGWLSTGSSIAILTALNAFRYWARKTHPSSGFRILFSSSSHHAVSRMAYFSGFYEHDLKEMPSKNHRTDLEVLAKELQKAQQEEKIPFVLATAGTTNLGAIDPLSEIADLCKKYGAWMHVDAAYGFAFSLLPELREQFAGLSRAQTINFDFHKSFSLPYGAGCLLARDASLLQIPQWKNGSYMPPSNPSATGLLLDPADFAPELSRDFKALKIWLSLRARGLQKQQRDLRYVLQKSRDLAQALSRIDGLRVIEPELSVIGVLAGDAGQKLLETLNSGQKVKLSSCIVENKTCIRVCVLSPEIKSSDIDDIAEEFRIGWQMIREAE